MDLKSACCLNSGTQSLSCAGLVISAGFMRVALKEANKTTEAGGALRLLAFLLQQSDAAFRLTDVVSEDDVLPLTASTSRPLFTGDNMKKNTANVH